MKQEHDVYMVVDGTYYDGWWCNSLYYSLDKAIEQAKKVLDSTKKEGDTIVIDEDLNSEESCIYYSASNEARDKYVDVIKYIISDGT